MMLSGALFIPARAWCAAPGRGPITANDDMGAAIPALDPVVIAYFYQPGCRECLIVSNEVLPELEARCEGFYQLRYFDTGVKSNYLLLAAYQVQLDVKGDEAVCMIVNGRIALNGLKAIKTRLITTIEECVQQQLAGPPVHKLPIVTPPAGAGSPALLADRMRTFTLPAVLGSGLIDGLNPCAISTLVFFMSLLAVARVRARGLLIMGLAFGTGTFLTYTALGFGLLRTLRFLTGFEWLRLAVEAGMVSALVILACLSFRDAYRFKRSGNPSDVLLRIPDGMRTSMHRVMRLGLAGPGLAIGGFLAGSAVTALESVCTGQLYIPTLTLIIEDSGTSPELTARAWVYLLLYNIMFIVPLAAVFVATYLGLGTGSLLRWSKRNVVTAKIMLGMLFVVLAILLTLLYAGGRTVVRDARPKADANDSSVPGVRHLP